MRTTAELVGETVREIVILLAVFVPLDAAFHEGRLEWPIVICLVVLEIAGLILMVAGVILERND